MLAWRDVIDMKSQRKEPSWKMTILADSACSLVDVPDESRVHE
jgi:hypothetical protein